MNTEFVNRENEVRNNLRKSKHNFSPEINYIHIRTGINYLKKIVELIEELRSDYTFEEDTRDYKEVLDFLENKTAEFVSYYELNVDDIKVYNPKTQNFEYLQGGKPDGQENTEKGN